MTRGGEAVMDCGDLHNASLRDARGENGTPLWDE